METIAETLVEIGAEGSAGAQRGEVAVRRRQDAKVDDALLVVADPAHHPILQDPQQLDLERQGRVVDLVEEDRPPSAETSWPSYARTEPVKAPLA